MSETEQVNSTTETKPVGQEFRVAQENSDLPVRLNKRIGAILTTYALVHDSDPSTPNRAADISSREDALNRAGVNAAWYEHRQFVGGKVSWLSEIEGAKKGKDSLRGAVALNAEMGLDLSKPPTEENNARLLRSLQGGTPVGQGSAGRASEARPGNTGTTNRAENSRSETGATPSGRTRQERTERAETTPPPQPKRTTTGRPDTRSTGSSSAGTTETSHYDFGYFQEQSKLRLQREKEDAAKGGYERGKNLSSLINSAEGKARLEDFIKDCDKAIRWITSLKLSDETVREQILRATDTSTNRDYLESSIVREKRREWLEKHGATATLSQEEKNWAIEVRRMFSDLRDIRQFLLQQRVPSSPAYYTSNDSEKIYKGSFQKGWNESAKVTTGEEPWYLSQPVQNNYY